MEPLTFKNQSLNQHTKISGTQDNICQNKANKGKTLKKSNNEEN